MSPQDKADALIEALPYLQHFRDKTFLIKIGGSIMEDEKLVSDFMRDIAFLEIAGINPVIVHGGGKAINKSLTKAQIKPEFRDGMRITSLNAVTIVENTLNNIVNPNLVNLLNKHGGRATGFHGTNVFSASRQTKPDLGYVGENVTCHLEDTLYAISSGIVPIISPLGRDRKTQALLNINADLASAALAQALKPAKLVFVSDVPGLLQDREDPKSLIKSINQSQAQQLMEDGTISGGMLPKIRSALDTIQAGVHKVHFIDGRIPHTLLLEIFTTEGIGTEIIG